MKKIADMLYLFSVLSAGLALGIFAAALGMFFGMTLLFEIPTKLVQ